MKIKYSIIIAIGLVALFKITYVIQLNANSKSMVNPSGISRMVMRSSYRTGFMEFKDKSNISKVVKLINSVEGTKPDKMYNLDGVFGNNYIFIDISFGDGNRKTYFILENSLIYGEIRYKLGDHVYEEIRNLNDKFE